ncbi:hypothetical protein [Pseudomonas paralcaligenes]|uniref:hypothetical protein n=1 Tax=Pseudomonas paralcaligenes TaxID=2772558 RepID=UPI001C8010AC|nr:hypothetical protein [Pseudomonas paralcaligenes]
MKGKSLLAACLIATLAALSVGLYLLANDARLQADRYGLLREHDGQLLVQFGQHLVWLDREGREQRTLDLGELGIRAEGDFAVFANGDLLLYHRPGEPGLAHGLTSWLRLQDRHPRPLQAGEGFRRCNADGCQPFGRDLPAFDGAFHLLVEPDTQRVHVAHTREFRLYLLDEHGELLARSGTDELRFPNQLVMRGDQLWLADTNHHRLARVSRDPQDYGRVEESLNFRVSQQHRWPHQFAWDGQAWWVNAGDRNLANGRVVRLDDEGRVLAELSTTELGDPLAMAWFADSLWLADYDAPRLLRFDRATGALPAAQSATLTRLEAESRAAIEHWQLLSRLGLGGFVLVMLGGLYAAWRLEREETRAAFQGLRLRPLDKLIQQPAAPLPAGQTLWLDNRLLRWRPWIFLVPLLIAALFCSTLLLPLAVADQPPAITGPVAAMTGGVLFLLLLTAWLIDSLCRQRVGLRDDEFLIQQSARRQVVVPAERLEYGAQHLLTDDACVALGNGLFLFFDRRQVEQYLYPRLKQARARNPWAAHLALWRSRHPQLLAGVLVIVVALGMLLALRLLA